MNQYFVKTVWICFLSYHFSFVVGRDTVCGRPKATERIKGGDKASIDEFPWAVSLRGFYYYYDFICTGSIIGRKWVVTAAHCIGRTPWWVTVGQTKSYSPWPGDTYQIKRYHVHPSYNNKPFRDDIALLELKSELPLSGSVQPICVSENDVETDQQQCEFVGWGATGPGTEHSSQLLKMDVKLRRNCHGMVNPNDNICTQSSAQMPCPGDSGGPLMCKELNGRYFLKGVMSRSTQCESAYGSSVLAKVAHYVDWIQQVTGLRLGRVTEDGPVVQEGMFRMLDGQPERNEDDGQPGSNEPYGQAGRIGLALSVHNGLDHQDGSPMSSNTAAMPLTSIQIFLFVGVPTLTIGLIALMVVVIVLYRKSSHLKEDSFQMTDHCSEPGSTD